MKQEIRTYLEWRYRVNNHAKYQQYRDEWINNIPEHQLWYYDIEMNHLKNSGIYH